MTDIILITGGSRSGKSRYAQSLAESLAGPRVYVATATDTDNEMRVRIDRHRMERTNRGWATLETPRDLAIALRDTRHDYSVWLVDCLTFWISNLMFEASENSRSIDEAQVTALTIEVLEAAQHRARTLIFVTNEVGMAIVPDNPLARHYRDLVGRCNQVVAAAAHVVTLVVCGIPLCLKGDKCAAFEINH